MNLNNDDKCTASVLGILVGMAILERWLQKDVCWINDVKNDFERIRQQIIRGKYGAE